MFLFFKPNVDKLLNKYFVANVCSSMTCFDGYDGIEIIANHMKYIFICIIGL